MQTLRPVFPFVKNRVALYLELFLAIKKHFLKSVYVYVFFLDYSVYHFFVLHVIL